MGYIHFQRIPVLFGALWALDEQSVGVQKVMSGILLHCDWINQACNSVDMPPLKSLSVQLDYITRKPRLYTTSILH